MSWNSNFITILKESYFLFKKNNTLNIYIIYNSNKKLTYILADYPNFQYTPHIIISINIQQFQKNYFAKKNIY